MQNKDGLDMSLSSISQLSRSCSEMVQQHNATFKDLEKKIFSFYVHKQKGIPMKEISDHELSKHSDDIEEDDNHSLDQISFEKPNIEQFQEVLSNKNSGNLIGFTPEIIQKLEGELEYKRSRIFLEVNRWKVI